MVDSIGPLLPAGPVAWGTGTVHPLIKEPAQIFSIDGFANPYKVFCGCVRAFVSGSVCGEYVEKHLVTDNPSKHMQHPCTFLVNVFQVKHVVHRRCVVDINTSRAIQCIVRYRHVSVHVSNIVIVASARFFFFVESFRECRKSFTEPYIVPCFTGYHISPPLMRKLMSI